MMRALLQQGFGGPEVLVMGRLPVPQPGPGEVRVRVAACGVNSLDTQLRQGDFRLRPPLPHVLGSEVAGWIEQAGPGVTGLGEGDAVAICPWVGCGHCRNCRAGHPTTCSHQAVLGVGRPGGYAEMILAPARSVVPLPAGVGPRDAAALALVGTTAWHMLIGRARLRPAERVLVLAAGSGIGSMAVQIARHAGAQVIATAGSAEKRERAHMLGAHATIDHYQEDLVSRVLELTNGEGVDVVFEHTGRATFARSFASLAANGRLVTCGTLTGKEVQLDLEQLFVRQLSLLGSRGGTPGELADLLAVVARGGVQPVIDRVLPLEEGGAAHELMEARGHFGKILLAVD